MRSIIRGSILTVTGTLLGAWLQFANAALPGGISGHWYNPEQSGHGLTVLLVQPGFAQAVWHVFDPDGNPLTLVIEGEVSGHGFHGNAYAPRGMRFGEFDPADKEVSVWGEVSIEFSSCSRAELSWAANDPAYGEGSMQLHRLAGIVGADCTLPSDQSTEFGRYTGEVIQNDNPEMIEAFTGIVDLEGRLWGIERLFAPIPSPMWVGARVHQVVRAVPAQEGDALQGRADRVWWTLETGLREGRDVSGSWPDGNPGGDLTWQFGEDTFELTWTPADDQRELVAPIDAGVLAGRYEVPMSDQNPGNATAWLKIEANGRACIEMSPWYEPPGGCHFEGWIDAPDGEHGLVDFEFARPDESPGAPHLGRGWLTDGPDGLELILVGDGGFGLMAYPEP